METKKQTRKTSSKTKELILEVAREIAAEKGVGQLTLEAVADRAGISKGGLLYHFPGKKELIIAFDEFFRQYRTDKNTERNLTPDMDEYVDKIKKERERKNYDKKRLCRTSCKHFNVSRWCREYFVL